MIDLIERMREYCRTYNTADVAALTDFYAADIVFTSAQGVMTGRDAVLAVCGQMMTGFVDIMTPTRILGGNGVVMVELQDVLTARYDVPEFLGAPIKAGESRTLLLAGVYEFSGNLIQRVTLYAR